MAYLSKNRTPIAPPTRIYQLTPVHTHLSQQLLPSSIPLAPPTRDPSLATRSLSLNHYPYNTQRVKNIEEIQLIRSTSNPKPIVKKMMEDNCVVPKVLRHQNYQEIGHSLQAKQLKQLSKLLGNEDMEFDVLRKNIETLLTHNHKGNTYNGVTIQNNPKMVGTSTSSQYQWQHPTQTSTEHGQQWSPSKHMYKYQSAQTGQLNHDQNNLAYLLEEIDNYKSEINRQSQLIADLQSKQQTNRKHQSNSSDSYYDPSNPNPQSPSSVPTNDIHYLQTTLLQKNRLIAQLQHQLTQHNLKSQSHSNCLQQQLIKRNLTIQKLSYQIQTLKQKHLNKPTTPTQQSLYPSQPQSHSHDKQFPIFYQSKQYTANELIFQLQQKQQKIEQADDKIHRMETLLTQRNKIDQEGIMRASAGSRMGGSVGSGINGSPTDSVINNSGINQSPYFVSSSRRINGKQSRSQVDLSASKISRLQVQIQKITEQLSQKRMCCDQLLIKYQNANNVISRYQDEVTQTHSRLTQLQHEQYQQKQQHNNIINHQQKQIISLTRKYEQQQQRWHDNLKRIQNQYKEKGQHDTYRIMELQNQVERGLETLKQYQLHYGKQRAELQEEIGRLKEEIQRLLALMEYQRDKHQQLQTNYYNDNNRYAEIQKNYTKLQHQSQKVLKLHQADQQNFKLQRQQWLADKTKIQQQCEQYSQQIVQFQTKIKQLQQGNKMMMNTHGSTLDAVQQLRNKQVNQLRQQMRQLTTRLQSEVKEKEQLHQLWVAVKNQSKQLKEVVSFGYKVNMSNENISNSRRTPPQSVSPSPSIEKDRKNSPPMSKKPSQKSYHSISVESQAQPPTPPTRPMMTTIQRLVDEYQQQLQNANNGNNATNTNPQKVPNQPSHPSLTQSSDNNNPVTGKFKYQLKSSKQLIAQIGGDILCQQFQRQDDDNASSIEPQQLIAVDWTNKMKQIDTELINRDNMINQLRKEIQSVQITIKEMASQVRIFTNGDIPNRGQSPLQQPQIGQSSNRQLGTVNQPTISISKPIIQSPQSPQSPQSQRQQLLHIIQQTLQQTIQANKSLQAKLSFSQHSLAQAHSTLLQYQQAITQDDTIIRTLQANLTHYRIQQQQHIRKVALLRDMSTLMKQSWKQVVQMVSRQAIALRQFDNWQQQGKQTTGGLAVVMGVSQQLRSRLNKIAGHVQQFGQVIIIYWNQLHQKTNNQFIQSQFAHKSAKNIDGTSLANNLQPGTNINILQSNSIADPKSMQTLQLPFSVKQIGTIRISSQQITQPPNNNNQIGVYTNDDIMDSFCKVLEEQWEGRQSQPQPTNSTQPIPSTQSKPNRQSTKPLPPKPSINTTNTHNNHYIHNQISASLSPTSILKTNPKNISPPQSPLAQSRQLHNTLSGVPAITDAIIQQSSQKPSSHSAIQQLQSDELPDYKQSQLKKQMSIQCRQSVSIAGGSSSEIEIIQSQKSVMEYKEQRLNYQQKRKYKQEFDSRGQIMSQKQINTRKENSKSKGKKNEDREHYSKTQKVIGDQDDESQGRAYSKEPTPTSKRIQSKGQIGSKRQLVNNDTRNTAKQMDYDEQYDVIKRSKTEGQIVSKKQMERGIFANRGQQTKQNDNRGQIDNKTQIENKALTQRRSQSALKKRVGFEDRQGQGQPSQQQQQHLFEKPRHQQRRQSKPRSTKDSQTTKSVKQISNNRIRSNKPESINSLAKIVPIRSQTQQHDEHSPNNSISQDYYHQVQISSQVVQEIVSSLPAPRRRNIDQKNVQSKTVNNISGRQLSLQSSTTNLQYPRIGLTTSQLNSQSSFRHTRQVQHLRNICKLQTITSQSYLTDNNNGMHYNDYNDHDDHYYGEIDQRDQLDYERQEAEEYHRRQNQNKYQYPQSGQSGQTRQQPSRKYIKHSNKKPNSCQNKSQPSQLNENDSIQLISYVKTSSSHKNNGINQYQSSNILKNQPSIAQYVQLQQQRQAQRVLQTLKQRRQYQQFGQQDSKLSLTNGQQQIHNYRHQNIYEHTKKSVEEDRRQDHHYETNNDNSNSVGRKCGAIVGQKQQAVRIKSTNKQANNVSPKGKQLINKNSKTNNIISDLPMGDSHSRKSSAQLLGINGSVLIPQPSQVEHISSQVIQNPIETPNKQPQQYSNDIQLEQLTPNTLLIRPSQLYSPKSPLRLNLNQSGGSLQLSKSNAIDDVYMRPSLSHNLQDGIQTEGMEISDNTTFGRRSQEKIQSQSLKNYQNRVGLHSQVVVQSYAGKMIQQSSVIPIDQEIERRIGQQTATDSQISSQIPSQSQIPSFGNVASQLSLVSKIPKQYSTAQILPPKSSTHSQQNPKPTHTNISHTSTSNNGSILSHLPIIVQHISSEDMQQSSIQYSQINSQHNQLHPQLQSDKQQSPIKIIQQNQKKTITKKPINNTPTPQLSYQQSSTTNNNNDYSMKNQWQRQLQRKRNGGKQQSENGIANTTGTQNDEETNYCIVRHNRQFQSQSHNQSQNNMLTQSQHNSNTAQSESFQFRSNTSRSPPLPNSNSPFSNQQSQPRRRADSYSYDDPSSPHNSKGQFSIPTITKNPNQNLTSIQNIRVSQQNLDIHNPNQQNTLGLGRKVQDSYVIPTSPQSRQTLSLQSNQPTTNIRTVQPQPSSQSNNHQPSKTINKPQSQPTTNIQPNHPSPLSKPTNTIVPHFRTQSVQYLPLDSKHPFAQLNTVISVPTSEIPTITPTFNSIDRMSASLVKNRLEIESTPQIVNHTLENRIITGHHSLQQLSVRKNHIGEISGVVNTMSNLTIPNQINKNNQSQDNQNQNQNQSHNNNNQPATSQTLSQASAQMQRMTNQLVSNQRIYQQTMSNQTISNQTIPSQTRSNQQVLNQRISNQTITNQPMSNQLMTNQTMSSNQSLSNQILSNRSNSNHTMPSQPISNQPLQNLTMLTQRLSYRPHHTTISNQILPNQRLLRQTIPNQKISHLALPNLNITPTPNPNSIMLNPQRPLQNSNLNAINLFRNPSQLSQSQHTPSILHPQFFKSQTPPPHLSTFIPTNNPNPQANLIRALSNYKAISTTTFTNDRPENSIDKFPIQLDVSQSLMGSGIDILQMRLQHACCQINDQGQNNWRKIDQE